GGATFSGGAAWKHSGDRWASRRRSSFRHSVRRDSRADPTVDDERTGASQGGWFVLLGCDHVARVSHRAGPFSGDEQDPERVPDGAIPGAHDGLHGIAAGYARRGGRSRRRRLADVPELAELFAHIARELHTGTTPEQTATRIVTAAVHAVPECDHAGVS